jgi:hypothetical protein
MKRALLAAMALAGGGAYCLASPAGEAPPAAPRPGVGCPADAAELPVEALYGRWEARFGDLPAAADVRMAKHPDYAGSVRGTIVRGGLAADLSGDIDDDGLLTLDESQDGLAISAVWSGELQPSSCGKEFKGTWRNSKDGSTQPFVLRKIGNP